MATQYNAMLDHARQLERELQSARKDAQRYRLWRKLWCADDDLEEMNALPAFDGEDEWDAILDRALGEEGRHG